MAKQYFVYILTNATRVLYIGMTNNLERRIWEHTVKRVPGFTAQYNISWLVYYEEFDQVLDALDREKQLKGWRRAKKIALIERMNTEWRDLALDWFPAGIDSEQAAAELAKDGIILQGRNARPPRPS